MIHLINITKTKAIPRSKNSIKKVVDKLRAKHSINTSFKADILKILDTLDYEIVEDNELNELVYAQTDSLLEKIYIKESVFIRASKGIPRDLFTIAHEIGHYILHDLSQIILCRKNSGVKIYEDPEWQANQFAAELLVPLEEVKKNNLSITEIMKRYNVSKETAEYRKKAATKS